MRLHQKDIAFSGPEYEKIGFSLVEVYMKGLVNLSFRSIKKAKSSTDAIYGSKKLRKRSGFEIYITFKRRCI